MSHGFTLRVTCCALAAAAIIAQPARAQVPLGSAFTYQGHLKNGGSPVSGNFNMVFKLWNDPALSAPANQVGSTITFDGVGGNPPQVNVTNGLFTAQLDFGATAFTGSKRWLAVTVNGTTLTPRQELTAAPNALLAVNADRLDGLDSAAFLQSIPVPLSLSGTNASHIIRGENASTTSGAAGVIGSATGTTGATSGVYGECDAPNARGVYGLATNASGGYGVMGRSGGTVVNAFSVGVYGDSSADDGYGVFGIDQFGDGATTGGYFWVGSTAGRGVYAEAFASSGTTYGVRGRVNSASGYAGYFEGRGYFSSNVGIGTTAPGNKLEVVAAANGDGIRLTGATSPLQSPGYHLYDGATQRGTLGLAEGATAYSSDAAIGDIVLRSNTGKLLLQNGTGVSAIAISGNNVGIGTTTPSATLDVNGSIAIAPVTRYFSCTPHAFVPGDYTMNYSVTTIGPAGFLVGFTSGQALNFNAPIHLPDGATITRFQATVFDSSGANITVDLNALDVNPGTGQVLGSVASSGSPGLVVLADTTITGSVVDNNQRAYWVQAHWTEPASGEIGIGCVRIDYTITTPLP